MAINRTLSNILLPSQGPEIAPIDRNARKVQTTPYSPSRLPSVGQQSQPIQTLPNMFDTAGGARNLPFTDNQTPQRSNLLNSLMPQGGGINTGGVSPTPSTTPSADEIAAGTGLGGFILPNIGNPTPPTQQQTPTPTPTPTTCQPGFVLVNGQCVPQQVADRYPSNMVPTPEPTPTPTPEPEVNQEEYFNSLQDQINMDYTANLTELFNQFRTAYNMTTQQAIEAARGQADLNRQSMQQQLDAQRQDFNRARQSIEEDSFMRGRNLLSNLANRGLATTGLLQLGEIQEAIAKGASVNDLAGTFNQARQAIEQEKRALETNLQQYESAQQAGLATNLANVNLQQRSAAIQDGERKLGLMEDMIAALSTPGLTPEQKESIENIYSEAINAPFMGLSDTIGGEPTTPTTPGTPTTPEGSLGDIFGGGQVSYDPITLGQGLSNYEGVSLSVRETERLNKVMTGSKYFNRETPEGKALLGSLEANPNAQVGVSRTNSPVGKAGLNDTYALTFPDGTSAKIQGREFITLIMNGSVQVSKEDAVKIMQTAAGSIASSSSIVGDEWDAFAKPYLQWLQDQGFVEKVTAQGGRGFYRVTED